MSKHKSLAYQMKQEISSQAKIGSSRHESKKDSADHRHSEFIHSKKTLENTLDKIGQFGHFASVKGRKTIAGARPYANEFIQSYTTWASQNTYAAALGRLYHESADHFTITAHDTTPTKGRSGVERYVNWDLHKDLLTFQQGVGLRHGDFYRQKNLAADDFYEKDGRAFLKVHASKGGRARVVPVLDEYKDEVKRIVEAARSTGKGKVFLPTEVPRKGNFHALRREYAKALYRQEIASGRCGTGTKEETYYCRGKRKGECYDKRALSTVAFALGHSSNRYYTVVHNYMQ